MIASGKSLAVFALLFAVLNAGDCATLGNSREESGGTAQPVPERQPFPGTRQPLPVEPTVVSYPDYRDPLIGLNRAIFVFNDVTYRYLLIPLAKGYVRVVPAPVRRGVGNFFYNIKTPVYAVNHLLQGEPEPLGRNLSRFAINTTVGLLGLFDPASAWWGLEKAETDFEDTLAGYGAGYGIYLVLPLAGPSDLRNGVSLLVDHYLNPIVYLTENPERNALLAFDFFQAYAPSAGHYETLRRKSEDPYLFFRNLHLQGVRRDADY